MKPSWRLILVGTFVTAVLFLGNSETSRAGTHNYEAGVDNVEAVCPSVLYYGFDHVNYCLWNYDFGSAQTDPSNPDVTDADNPITLIFTGSTLSNSEIQADEGTTYDGQALTDEGSTDDGIEYDYIPGTQYGETQQFSAHGKKIPSTGYAKCVNNDLSGIESSFGISSNDLSYYLSGGKDWCDYHMRIYGPTYDPAVGYFTFADTHEDWNDTACSGTGTVPCNDGNGHYYPRFFGWYEDAALYMENLFRANGGVGGNPTATVTTSWASLGNNLSTESGKPNCTGSSVTEANGSSGPRSTVTGHYVKWTGDGSSTPLYTLYCKQSDGYADRIDLSY